MELLIMDQRSRNSAYFLREPSGRIVPVGFGELMNKNVRFSELDGAVILAQNEEIPEEDCLHFDQHTLSNKTVIEYLEDRKAIGCLFVKVFGLWVQSDLRILQNHIKEVPSKRGIGRR